MSKAKVQVKTGQEWERSAGQVRPKRIRIKGKPNQNRVQVVTVEGDRELRPRELLRDSLNNTRSGWTLVKDVE